MNNLGHLLKSIGIPEKWAEIYIYLIEQWEASIADIAKDIWFHRMEIYRQLPFMLESWLIIEVQKWKRKEYIPAHPHTIQTIFEKQKEETEQQIQRLTEQYSYLWKKPRVIYQEGKKGISFVFADIINTLSKGEVFYRVSSEQDVSKANTYLPKDYRKKRDAKNLERYVIMSESWATEKVPRLERELVTIPKNFDEFEENISLTIYKNKIAYIDFSTQTSIIIEQKELADFQRKLFILLFKSLRK